MPRTITPDAMHPSPYPALIIKYALIAVYGAANGWVGVITLGVVSGPSWAVMWPALVLISSTAALVGVLISRSGGTHWPEMIATLALISLLIGYSAAIIIRTVEDGNVTRLPVALLPIILSVFPFSRLVSISRGTVKR